jgi:hypothetical protein
VRCFFHLTDGQEDPLDQDGIDVRSIYGARIEALRALDQLRHELHHLQEDWNDRYKPSMRQEGCTRRSCSTRPLSRRLGSRL